MLFKIALKNLLGARLRTFLNVLVTAFSFFLILFMSAMYDGMLQHTKQVTMDTEIAGGAYWHPKYDPLNPMTFEDAHSVPPVAVQALVDEKKSIPGSGEPGIHLSWRSHHAYHYEGHSTCSEYC